MGMILSCISNIMYLSEKLTLWVTCVGLIFCIVIMFIITLGMGIGLGYNYCFVDLKTRYKYVPGHYIYPGSPRWPHRSGNAPEPGRNAAGEAVQPNQPSEPQEDTPPSEDDKLRAPVTFPEEVDDVYFAAIKNRPYFYIKNGSFTDEPYAPSYNESEDSEETMPMFPKSEPVTATVPDFSMDPAMDLSKEPSMDPSMEPSMDPSEDPSDDPSEDLSEDSSTEFNATIEEFTTTFSTDTFETSEPITDLEMRYDENGDPIHPHPHPTMGEDPTNRRVKKLVIPISGGDLLSLLAKLKAEKKNYSVQIVTT